MILVTGATGFIGKNLVKELLKEDYELKILTRKMEEAKNLFPETEIVKGDVTDKSTLKNIAKDVDLVVHLAGLVSYSDKRKSELFDVNVNGTKNLLESCENVDKFIFSSSVSVFSPIKDIADEDYPCDPKNMYGLSKLNAENLVSSSGVKNIIFRIAPVYGVGSSSWLKNLKLLEKGFPVPDTKNLTHIVHVSDVAQAVRLGLKKGRGLYIIADKKPIKFLELSELIMDQLGKKTRKMPVWMVNTFARFSGMKQYLDVLTANRNYDISKAEKDLGYKPRADLKVEIKKMIEWYRKIT